ncbi:Acetylornithine deacetylase [Rhodovastum atsumiense]|uniref:M20 family metallopeptidase n=1 Tax=Rhodovastum atsumiense TaxID=504468 RepID=A0A5M6IT62_9PROT|nr:M20/M25/M40 family metallo-hydrolase [Rhodovastum atsumiense]KAA5611506.1 M20 family metallopeptidase [Rhodovastum atsumiense]CAH2601205.1 Acetylornithine deacetylase [Rhodovastum atsumiense]
MTEFLDDVAALARELVRIDSRSFVSNLPLAAAVEAALPGFAIERIDYADAAGVAKRALVARRGTGSGGLAFSGHMDTVPDTGWTEDPWSGRIDGDTLHGLGSTDMKGPLAACIVAARALPERVPVMLVATTDEETSKRGAQEIAARSVLVREAPPAALLVAEPTRMRPVRGHRSHINFNVVATGVQAHSSTGRGRNANWDLVEFLAEMKALYRRLREDAALQDPAYDPPFSDFNPVIDNHGTAVNVTVPKATLRIKFRYSAGVDPDPVRRAVQDAATRHGLAVTEEREGAPPELPADHPLVRLCADLTGQAPATAPYGTDASELQGIAPCVVLGPGDIAQAHTPTETARLSDLARAVPVFMRLAERVAAG